MRPEEYRNLIQDFLNGKFESADAFARFYDKTFREDPDHFTDELFYILEDFFEDVEAYDPMWTLEDVNFFRITEEMLKEEAVKAIEELDKYMQDRKNIG